MKIAVYSSKSYEKPFLNAANTGAAGSPQHELVYLAAPLAPATADLARGCPAVSIFVGDNIAYRPTSPTRARSPRSTSAAPSSRARK